MKGRKICTMPARRPGASLQKSASQRLADWMPAQRRGWSLPSSASPNSAHHARREGRGRIREHHLGDHAVGLGLAQTPRAVPVAVAVDLGVAVDADAPVAHHLAHHPGHLGAPFQPLPVLGLPLPFEVGAEALRARPGVGIRRDQQVAVEFGERVRHGVAPWWCAPNGNPRMGSGG